VGDDLILPHGHFPDVESPSREIWVFLFHWEIASLAFTKKLFQGLGRFEHLAVAGVRADDCGGSLPYQR
jgi:hypothetical protein